MPDANANPDKRFFIDLIIRDISLEDAMLDLIDNAIDALVRTKQIDLYKGFVNRKDGAQDKPLAEIKISFSTKQFRINDNCGGIPFESAEKDVFRFGHPDPHRGVSLSVFGIGMKRAIFKIGREIEIVSHASDSGFLMRLDVDKWLGVRQLTGRYRWKRREGRRTPPKQEPRLSLLGSERKSPLLQKTQSSKIDCLRQSKKRILSTLEKTSAFS